MAARTLGERLGAGKEAEVFATGADAIKLYPPGIGKEVAFREGAALAIIERLGLPAPRVIAVECVGGRWGLVMTRCEGHSFAAAVAGEPAAMHLHVEAAVRLQLRINACTASGLPSLKARLARDIGASAVLGVARQSRLLDGLRAMPDGDRLCHGDFHLANVLGTVTNAIVVDWLDACNGPREADACRSYLLLNRRMPVISEAYLESYAALSGLSRCGILGWLPLLAAARIAEGVPAETEALMALADQL